MMYRICEYLWTTPVKYPEVKGKLQGKGTISLLRSPGQDEATGHCFSFLP
jgi:hypothetical protein